MPRFTGRNNDSTGYHLRAQSPGDAKAYFLAPATTFDIYVNDVEASEIRSQLSGLGSGVVYEEKDTGVHAQLIQFNNIAAADNDGVHAAVEEGAALLFPGPITNPAIPRNITATFAAGWQGGDITIVGTDQYDVAQTEVIADAAGSTVAGTKIFKTVTSITKELVAGTTDTVTIGWGDKIGISANVIGDYGALFVAGASEAVTVDSTRDAFTPTTVPDGAVDYTLIVNV